MIFDKEMFASTTYRASSDVLRQSYNVLRLEFESVADTIFTVLDKIENEETAIPEEPLSVYAYLPRRFSIPAISMNLLVLNNKILSKYDGNAKQCKIKRVSNSTAYLGTTNQYSYEFAIVKRDDNEYEPQNLADTLTFSKLTDEIYKNTKLYRMGKNMLVKYVVWTKMKACYTPWELHKIEKILYRENNLQRHIVRSILPDTDGKYTYYAFKEVGRPIVEFVDNKEQS